MKLGTECVLLFVFISLAGCASVEDLSRSAPFADKVGQILRTQRVTYVYDFDAGDAPMELWDNTDEFVRPDADDQLNMMEVRPVATCAPGSEFQLQRVLRVRRFNNPESIKARGRIVCGEQVYDVAYDWERWNSIIDMPREKRSRPLDHDGSACC